VEVFEGVMRVPETLILGRGKKIRQTK
jgi:hypothetical protein